MVPSFSNHKRPRETANKQDPRGLQPCGPSPRPPQAPEGLGFPSYLGLSVLPFILRSGTAAEGSLCPSRAFGSRCWLAREESPAWGFITSQLKFNIGPFMSHSPPPWPLPALALPQPVSSVPAHHPPPGKGIFPENWKNQVLPASDQC